jgi:hypothetical protein
MLINVKTLRAHVRNGQIVLDEPAELCEGASVEVLVSDDDAMVAADREELEVAVDESAAEFSRGEFEDARSFAQRLAAKP